MWNINQEYTLRLINFFVVLVEKNWLNILHLLYGEKKTEFYTFINLI